MATMLLLLAPVCANATELVFESNDQRMEVPIERLNKVAVTRDFRDQWAVQLRLNSDDSRAFADLTTASVGQMLVVSVCGEILLQPNVQSPIIGGVLQIGAISREDAERLLATLKGDEPCSEVND